MAENTEKDGAEKKPKDFAGAIDISEQFAQANRMILRDMNNPRVSQQHFPFSKEQIQIYLLKPSQHEKELRDACIYMYNASSHFRRLIQYFVGLTDWAYIIKPYRTDLSKQNKKTVQNSYRKTVNLLSAMNIETQAPNVLTVCLREDTFYGTFRVSSDNITIQRLPSNYCSISEIENNVPNVAFDFTYFDKNPQYLANYPEEFQYLYENVYSANKKNKWITLSAPNSFAVKCNSDNYEYSLPPFAGLLRELYDLEEYERMKMLKLGIENYAMLVMRLPMGDDGEWGIDLDKARDFWKNLEAVIPEEVGSVLTPMDISKISFEKTNTADVDTIAEAEQHLFTAAGVQSLLFNNEKASANSLNLSIKADQAITYGIVKNFGAVINRYLHEQNYGKIFEVSFLNTSVYNSKEVGDAVLKGATYGFPTVSMFAATEGLGQGAVDSMSYLENEILDVQNTFKPLLNSAQISVDDVDSSDEGGAPTKEPEDLSDSREANQESE